MKRFHDIFDHFIFLDLESCFILIIISAYKTLLGILVPFWLGAVCVK